MLPKCPCHYCDKRKAYCHSTCEDYISYKTECDRLKKKVYDEKEKELYFIERINRKRGQK